MEPLAPLRPTPPPPRRTRRRRSVEDTPDAVGGDRERVDSVTAPSAAQPVEPVDENETHAEDLPAKKRRSAETPGSADDDTPPHIDLLA
ncbi:MAG: hypothetical protein KDC38_03900 [Planctomycetes bacterium]|nr:hypothetical protein [Planctomycetota bacterium]